MNTNTKNNPISITQAIQFENGKKIFSIFYVPGLFANTPWALYKNNCYKALNTDIKEVVKKTEENGWVVFNYTNLPDSDIWEDENEHFSPEITFLHIRDRVHNPSRPGIKLTAQEVEDILEDISMLQIYCEHAVHSEAIFLHLQSIFMAVTKSYNT